MNGTIFILLLVLYFIHIICVESTFCEDHGDIPQNFKQNFATKTGYLNVLKDDSFMDAFEDETADCTPLKVWFFSRHGTRYPLENDMMALDVLPSLSEKLVLNHFEGRGCLSEEDVFKFKSWVRPYEIRDHGELHPTGADELFDMGEHWRKMYPKIFAKPYDPFKIKVEFTIKNRTGQSAYHFVRGLYGDNEISNIKLPKPYSTNFIVRFHKNCPRWMTEVYKNNKTTYKERNLFEQTNWFQQMVLGVTRRLGFSKPLDHVTIIAMYDECRYETAWFPEAKSIWCTPFNEKDLEILEYYQDLKYYYEDSYGTPLNTGTACKAASDLYLHMKTKVSATDDVPNAVLYFSHDKATMQLEALLGLFRPKQHLRHDNFDKDRKFKTSFMGSFTSNLGFILYECGNDYKVGFLFNGNAYPLTSVCSSPLCKWGDYEQFLEPIYRNCDLAKLCRLHDEL